MIAHLQNSPVFYPGTEFTQDVYRGFFFDPDTTVYIAEDNKKIIGLIQANPESDELMFAKSRAVNVGEAYVNLDYRGKGVAQALLSKLESDLVDKGITYDWVEHGTANPTARGFWNKYFDAFSYEMTRSVEVKNR